MAFLAIFGVVEGAIAAAEAVEAALAVETVAAGTEAAVATEAEVAVDTEAQLLREDQELGEFLRNAERPNITRVRLEDLDETSQDQGCKRDGTVLISIFEF